MTGKSRKSKKLSPQDFEEIESFEKRKKTSNDLKDFHSFHFQKDIILKTEKQKELMKKIHENDIVFVAGPAGCGKTFVALKAALEILKDPSKPVNQILITKPIVEAAEKIGHLPGTLEEKIEPYLKSYTSNMRQLIGGEPTRLLIQQKVVEFSPLAYMRGDTFRNCIAIFDEAQNTTVTGLKLFLSRIGENSKLIVMGDIDQIDIVLRNGEKSGLEDSFIRFKDLENNGIGFVTFDEDDIVRHSILRALMKCYKKK